MTTRQRTSPDVGKAKEELMKRRIDRKVKRGEPLTPAEVRFSYHRILRNAG